MKTNNFPTTLRVNSETRDRLIDIGRKNESYDILINKLIDHYHNFTINPRKGKKK